jgi:hypothetical protein
LSDFKDGIDVFLLGMENKNPDGDQQSVDGEGDDSRRSPKTRPERGRKDESIFTAVKKDSECPGQHDAEQWDHPDENAEHAGLERGMNGNSPVHRAGHCAWAIGMPGLRNLRRKLVRRGIQAGGNPSIRNRNLHVDLSSVALRTKRPTVLDRAPTLLAKVLHISEASAQRTRRATRLRIAECSPLLESNQIVLSEPV